MLLAGIERRGVVTPRGLLLVLSAGLLAFAGCGGGGSGNASGDATSSSGSATTSQISLFAGNGGGGGNADGPGAVARFTSPRGIATDRAGNIYVADTYNFAIRKISTTGMVTTLVGKTDLAYPTYTPPFVGPYGYSNPGPNDIAVDSAGNVYVGGLSSLPIRKVTPAGKKSELNLTSGHCGQDTAPSYGSDVSGPLATDSADNLYVAVTTKHIVCKITPAGVVSTLAGTDGVSGSADGAGTSASFSAPSGIATDSVGNVYVADAGNLTVRKITPAGVVTTLAGTAGVVGSADGTGAAASFRDPVGVSTDAAGNVYVVDRSGNTIRKITPAGVVTTVAGTAGVSGSADGTAAAASFFAPWGLATDAGGNIYVGDTNNNTIRKISPAGTVSTIAGMAASVGRADGTGTAASFNFPMGLSTDAAGNVYVADIYNTAIRKITSAGVVTTLAGPMGPTDSDSALASFYETFGTATDSVGNVYVALAKHNVILKITPAGVVSTLAGAYVKGNADGTGAAAMFNYPIGVATDSAGNVYVADMNNNAVRKITPAGVVTTLAGALDRPLGIATDSAGNLYVPDTGNSLLRKITPAGSVSTLATTGGAHWEIPDPASNFVVELDDVVYLVGVAVDSVGNIYVADTGHGTILKVTAAGAVSTLVGTSGQVGFQPGNLPGVISGPTGLAISGSTLYFTLPNGIGRVTNLF